MNQSAKRTIPILVLVFVSAYAWVGAQAPAKKALGVEDYTRWRTISGQEISEDGAWVTYGVAVTNVAPTDTKPVLHLLNLSTNQDVEVANGAGGRTVERKLPEIVPVLDEHGLAVAGIAGQDALIGARPTRVCPSAKA